MGTPGAASMPVQRVRESRVRDLIESDTQGEGFPSATRKACPHVAVASRRDMMNLGRLGRARALAAQQSCPPLSKKVIDVVDGEREHGRSLLVEFAARGALGERSTAPSTPARMASSSAGVRASLIEAITSRIRASRAV